MRILGVFFILLAIGLVFPSHIEIHVMSTSNQYIGNNISTGISDGTSGSRDVTLYGPMPDNFSSPQAWQISFDGSGNPVVDNISASMTSLSSHTDLWNTSNEVDDAMTGEISLPFNVSMFGRENNVIKVSSNGFIFVGQDSISTASTGCCSGLNMSAQTISGTDFLIAGAWTDLHVYNDTINANAYIGYNTEGTAPNRVFIVYFHNVSGHYYGNLHGGYEFQIKFFENDTESEPPTPGYGYGYEESHRNHASRPLSVDLNLSCENNVVTVTSGGDPVLGAHVAVIDIAGGPIFSGDTDADGKVTFQGCGMDVMVYASKSGYLPDSVDTALAACDCGSECSADTDCSSDMKCSDGSCVAVPCPCGEVATHACNAYRCCSSSECSQGQVCENHACAVVTPTDTGNHCTQDNDCGPTEKCIVATGACSEITGCGSVTNHVLTPYECGSEANCPSCPSGESCRDHSCVSTVTQGPTGTVGGTVTVQIPDETEAPCKLCTIVITAPDGSTTTVQTDENGNVQLPLAMAGAYKLTLMRDGNPVNTIEVKSFPKSPPVVPTGGAATQQGADSGSLLAMLGLLVLLVGAVLVIVFMFGKGRLGGGKGKKGQIKMR